MVMTPKGPFWIRRPGGDYSRVGIGDQCQRWQVAVLSSLMKNIGALVIFVPIARQMAAEMARRREAANANGIRFADRRPFTLISGPRRIFRSRGYARSYPACHFAMFDFAPVGLGIVVVGLAFLAVGWRLLPGERRSHVTPDETLSTHPCDSGPGYR